MNRFALRSDPAAAVQSTEEKKRLSQPENGSADANSLRKDPVAGVESIEGVCVVRLAGELDLYNANAVRQALFDAAGGSPDRLVVDLSDVEFIDSTALGVLIEARTKLPNRRAFLLASPGLETKRALEISGLDRHFTVHDTVPEALKASL